MLMKTDAAAQRAATMDPNAPVALVIGSGFGGLAAGVRLAARGWRVQVLEKLDVPGGRARVHHVDGYTFDAGPTIITVPFLLDELWAHAVKPEFTWVQQWRAGDVIIWDNRCTMHRRDSFDEATRRLMHRTQIRGGRPQ